MQLPDLAPFRELVTPAFLTLVTQGNPTLDGVRETLIAFMDSLEARRASVLWTHVDLAPLKVLVQRLAPAFTSPGDYSWMLAYDRSPLLISSLDLLS